MSSENSFCEEKCGPSFEWIQTQFEWIQIRFEVNLKTKQKS